MQSAAPLEKIQALYEVSKSIGSAKDTQELLNAILDSSLFLTGSDSGSVMLLNETHTALVVKASRNLPEAVLKDIQVKLGERISGVVAQKEEAIVLVGKANNHPDFRHIEPRTEISCSMSAPLRVGGNLVGVLNVNRTHTRDVFGQEDLKALTIVATFAARVINDAKLLEDLRLAQKKLEEAHESLIQQEKLASLWRLSESVAKEMSVPLTTISGFVEKQLKKTPEADPSHSFLLQAKEAKDHMEKLLEKLFGQSASPLKINLKQIVDETLAFMEPTFYRYPRVRRVMDIPGQLPKVSMDPGQFQQAMMHLLTNALESMGKAMGLLTVRAYLHASKVCIEVSDTGCGIPRENLKRVYEPFFTTKEGARGMGLFVVYRTVKSHDGDMGIESIPGKGTTVKLVFPSN